MTTHSTTAYIPLPSTFTCVEKPLRYVYDRFDPSHNNALHMYLAGMIVYPLTLCAASVTMVADMAIGVAECTFCTLRGSGLRDVAELAKKKIIISPLHHLIFVTTSLAESAFVIVLWNYNVLSAKFWLVLFTYTLCGLSSPLICSMSEAEFIQNMQNANSPFRSLFENKMLNIALQISFIAKAAWDLISLVSTRQLTVLKIVIPIALASLRWIFNYTLSQRLIGSFSPSWNHQALSIFRDRGAPVKEVGTRFVAKDPVPNSTFQDLAFSDCNTAFWEAQFQEYFEEHDPNTNRLPRGASAAEWKDFWTNFISNDRGKIDSSNAHEKNLYNQFRDSVLAGKPAIELLKLPEDSSKSAILKAYKTYSRVLHSDTNPTRFDEASILFKCLGEAKFQLIED
jgi:hypothetical protein